MNGREGCVKMQAFCQCRGKGKDSGLAERGGVGISTVRSPRVVMPTDSSALHPSSGSPKPRRFEDQVRDACRIRHYSMRTEEAYWMWTRRFILFHGKSHPR